MAVSSVYGAGQNPAVPTRNNAAAGTFGAEINKEQSGESEAAIYEGSTPGAGTTQITYTRDTATLSEISKQVDAKLATLRETVEKLVGAQSVKNGEAQGLQYDQILEKYNGKLKEFYQNLEVDEPTRLQAQADIAEDGFWGVKQTSARTIAFAKALAGGDPSKIDILRNAIEEGYKAAEAAWGGQLPEICKQTQAAVLQGLDEWAKEAAQPADQSSTTAANAS